MYKLFESHKKQYGEQYLIKKYKPELPEDQHKVMTRNSDKLWNESLSKFSKLHFEDCETQSELSERRAALYDEFVHFHSSRPEVKKHNEKYEGINFIGERTRYYTVVYYAKM